MTRPAGDATFSLRSAQQQLGLSRAVLSGLIDAGFVTPQRGPRNALRFTFQDLTLLRSAHALQRAGIAPRKIVRALARLRARLPSALPLTGLRISAVGDDVAVRATDGRLESASGQLLMDFEIAAVGGQVVFLDHGAAAAEAGSSGAAAEPAPRGASGWFARGVALEGADPAAAEAAYLRALALQPDHADAALNLGALMCEAGRCAAAVALFDRAIAVVAPGSAQALLHFNRAVALEDLHRADEAAAGYAAALHGDPQLADAHYNLARLQEQRGDARGALRHFNAYRRLTQAQ